MTEETFYKAQQLDSKIAQLSYAILQAERITSNSFSIKIVGRNPRGDEETLSYLDDKNKDIREVLSRELKTRMEKELKALETEFNNL